MDKPNIQPILTNATLGMGIPTINRWDMLQNILPEYYKIWKRRHIVILDNGCQGIKVELPGRLITANENQGVSRSWNIISNKIYYFGYTHCLILNDDIEMVTKPDLLEKFIDDNPADMYVSPKGWSAIILPRDTFQKIGGFDTAFFPAYFEDNDYAYRLKLKGLKIVECPLLEPRVFRNSQTIAKDPSLNDKFGQNRELYIAKWGGLPGEEKYTTPYNK